MEKLQPARKSPLMVLIVCGLVLVSNLGQAAENNLALASSLRLVWPALLQGFATAETVQGNIADNRASNATFDFGVTFGSSGNLARQIQLGAPFNLFISANEEFANRLVDKKLTDSAGIIVAQGQLAWVVLRGSATAKLLRESLDHAAIDPVTSNPATANLAITNVATLNLAVTQQRLVDLLQRDAVASLAIANPQHAPYGVAAVQVLRSAGIENPGNEPFERLLKGENAAQALQFVLSGGAELGLIPLSLVYHSVLPLPSQPAEQHTNTQQQKTASEFVAVTADPETYQPVLHRIVLLSGAAEPVQALYDYLTSDEAKPVWQQYGFLAP